MLLKFGALSVRGLDYNQPEVEISHQRPTLLNFVFGASRTRTKLGTRVKKCRPEAAEWSKSTSDQIQDGGQHPRWRWWNRINSVADCSILLKFSLCWAPEQL